MQTTKNSESSRLEFLLDTSKQELMQADNKTGWTTAIYSAVIASLISLGIYLKNDWWYIGATIVYVLVGFLFVFMALIPKISLRKKGIKKTDGVNMISISDNGIFDVLKKTKNHYEKSLMESIQIYSKLATKKYRIIKFAFLWLFPPFLFTTLIKNMHKYIFNKIKKRRENG